MDFQTRQIHNVELKICVGSAQENQNSLNNTSIKIVNIFDAA